MFEKTNQECGDQASAVFRNEASLIQLHVVSILQHGQDRGVGGRPADPQFFHLLDQARLGIARRRLGEMLARVHFLAPERVALAHRRQHPVILFFRRPLGLIVGIFPIQLQEPVKGDDRPVRPKLQPLSVGNIDAHLIQFGRLHLRCHSPLPDQLV